MLSVGIQALAVHLPEGLRTNSWWNEETTQNNDNNELAYRHNSRYQFYDEAMAPYLADPFLGSIERRVVVDPNESSVSLGMKAATDVLQAAAISASEIDGLIATTMFADRVGIGDAGYLANELGIRGGAFNVEATCAGSMAALLTACALVKSGQKNRVLVVATAFFHVQLMMMILPYVFMVMLLLLLLSGQSKTVLGCWALTAYILVVPVGHGF